MKKGKIVVLFMLMLLVCCYCLYDIKYISLTKYNIYPRKAIENYLAETYDGEFKFWSSGFYKDKYLCIWTYRYVDEEGKIFPMYFEFEREAPEGGWATTFYKEAMDVGVRDYYWQTKLNDMYGNKLSSYAIDYSYGNGKIKYSFSVASEEDIYEVADMISEIFYNTTQTVECLSNDVLGIRVSYKDKEIYTIYADDEFLGTNQETLFQIIYEDIYEAWKK